MFFKRKTNFFTGLMPVFAVPFFFSFPHFFPHNTAYVIKVSYVQKHSSQYSAILSATLSSPLHRCTAVNIIYHSLSSSLLFYSLFLLFFTRASIHRYYIYIIYIYIYVYITWCTCKKFTALAHARKNVFHTYVTNEKLTSLLSLT